MRSRTSALLCVAALLTGLGSCAFFGGTPAPSGKQAKGGPTAAEAKRFVAGVDAELRRLWVAETEADWANATDITPEHEAVAAAASTASMTYLGKAIVASRRFDPILAKLDESTRRQIQLLRVTGTPAPKDPAHATELATLRAEMDGRYGMGKVCDAKGKRCKDLADLEDVMATSRKPAELLAAWQGWHETVGREMKPLYTRFVALSNEGAQVAGFADTGELWRARYDMTPAAFEADVDRLWGQVKPLYDELHCYTRRKLGAKYGKTAVPPTGPIPAHLLGNMWAQSWNWIFPLVEPYKGQPTVDVTAALVKQKYDGVKIVKLAEAFFVSLGLDPLPATFWERSLFAKPADREVICHASAWNMSWSGDVRLKACLKANQEELITAHHELGHNYYQYYFRTLPMLFQDSANDGFHEAIGDAVALSVTPAYLKQVGLLAKVGTDDKAAINQLMYLALDKVAFLPFGLLVDKWRWEVFGGRITPEQYNQRWWELRLQYQGVVPPIARGEADFDPGAKYHVPGNTPYMRYFLAVILQFQLHRALCKSAGATGALHECSVYGSKEAGAQLQKLLELGASKPWPDALMAMSGERALDASAIIDYFAPLMVWLQEQNKGQTCGW